MTPRTQPHRLQFPLTAEQVEKLDEMLQILFEELRNNAIFPFTTDGDLLYFDDAVLARLGIGSAELVLKSDGDLPLWGQVSLTDGVEDVLEVAHGGSGVAALTAYALLAGGTAATTPVQQVTALGSAGQVLKSNGAGALPTFQDIGLGGSDIAPTLQAPLVDESLSAGYSAVVNRTYTIADGKKLTLGEGARFRIL